MSFARAARLLVASMLVLITTVTAVAPHDHGNAESWFDPSADSQLTTCNAAPTALTHLDASRSRHHDPCIACERQHLPGVTLSGRGIIAPRVRSTLHVTGPELPEAYGQAPVVLLRGPPATTSFC